VARRPFSLARFALALLAAAFAAYLSSRWWLPVAGTALVEDDGPAKAEIGVVLGGDYGGNRIERAAELIRAGYIPLALISGPPSLYGFHENDLAIPYIVRQGYPVAWFQGLPHNALSTQAEARVVLEELRRRKISSFLLITSDFHSRRAARTFRYVGRSMGYLPSMRVVVSPDRLYRIDRWWQEREGQKAVFLEWTKTLAFAVGL